MALPTRLARPPRAPAQTDAVTALEPSAAPLPSSPPGPRREGVTYPLSVSQEQLWFLSRLAPSRPVYHELIAVEHDGRLDVGALQEALLVVLDRHEAWRTTFHADEATGEPVAVVGPVPRLDLAVLDLSDLDAEGAEDQAARWMAAVSSHPYHLDKGPLVRPQLVRLPGGRDRLYLAMHHMVFDGVSVYRVVLPQLADAYQALAGGSPPPAAGPTATYEDFARWERTWIDGDRARRRLDWWAEHLAGVQPLELPLDRPRPPGRSWRGSTVALGVDPPVVDALKAVARDQRASLFQVLATCFAAVLGRYSGQDDLVFATAADTRQRGEHRDVVGYCLTPLMLRVRLNGDPTFLELLAQVRNELLDGLDHLVPFDRVVRAVAPERDGVDTPLFSAMVILEPPMVTPDRSWRPVSIESRVSDAMAASKFHLEMGIDERPDGSLEARLIYDTDLWEPWRADAMATHWRDALVAVAADPSRRFSELAVSNRAEQRRQALGNATDSPLPQVPFHRLIEEQVRRTPSAPAVTCGAETLSYAALDRWADRIAGDLLAAAVTPGQVVAVCLPRGPGMIAALVGVMKSGAVYLPLDPTVPTPRLAGMVADAAAVAVLVDGSTEALARTLGAPVALPLAGAPSPLEQVSPVSVQVDAGAACYVLFTSGSTGRPKGTVIFHSALLNLVTFFATRLAISASDAVLALTTISFDISMLELFVPLVSGARVVVAPAGIGADGRALGALLEEERITLAQATPTTWRALVDSGWTGRSGLVGICGGEPLPRDLADDLLARGVTLYNAYGPTETTIWSTLDRVEAGGQITIGTAISNTRLAVLGGRGEHQPDGVAGELVIGGVGVAGGYLGLPELTAERFVDDPTRPGAVAYRTGDRVRRRPDGRLEHLGRLDEQVKLRGHRIEPSEIAQALRELPGVVDAAVIVRRDGGDDRLVAYLTGTPPNVAEMRAELAARLPSAMVPSAFEILDHLPTNTAGKVDKGALPAPSVPAVSPVAPSPLTSREGELAELWGALLHVPAVGPEEDFFALGGHSLLAVRLLHEVERRWGRLLPVSALWAGGGTVRGMAAMLDHTAAESPGSSPRVAAPVAARQVVMLFPHAWGQLAARHFDAVLGRDSVVALRLPVAGWRFDPGRSVEDMARELVGDIQSHQPHGPYALAGYSFAGTVAYEVAAQLRAMGEPVEWLGLLDAASRSEVFQQRRPRTLRERVGDRIRRGLPSVVLDARQLVAGWGNDLRQLANRPTQPVFDWGGAVTLMSAYVPRAHDVATTVFRCQVQPAGAAPDLGWGSVHTGPLEVVTVPGNHETFLAEPNVSEVARSFADAFGRAQVAAAKGTPAAG